MVPRKTKVALNITYVLFNYEKRCLSTCLSQIREYKMRLTKHFVNMST